MSPVVSPSPKPGAPAETRRKPQAMFALDPAALDLVYGPTERRTLAELVDLDDGVVLTPDNWSSHRERLRDVEFILSGWKSPIYDDAFLAAAPRLRGVFYAAGSVRYCTPDAFWRRGLVISSASAANAVPVAEYTVAVLILSLKQFWRRAALARRGEGWGDHLRPISGAFRATIGLVSFGAIARKVRELLAAHEVRVLVYCPLLSEAEAAVHGVRRVSLSELFRESDVVSVHAPVLPDTLGLVTGALVRTMRPDAALINTARGCILHQASVVEALRERPDLTAILDVTDPEPPAASDPLFGLPNVIVTPHIAGSHGRECQRLGQYAVDELRRFLCGQELRWRVTQDMAFRGA